MKILDDLDLAAFHTFALHTRATRLYRAETREDLKALHARGVFESPFHVLGEGSNTLFLNDMEIPILQVGISGIERVVDGGAVEVEGQTETETESESESEGRRKMRAERLVAVRAGAGTLWHDLVRWSVGQGLGGIEQLALIPGTCGAAPIQNIGAYGRELSDVLRGVECFDTRSGRFLYLSARECGLAYRDSRFKRNPDSGLVIVSITLDLDPSKDYRAEAGYRTLRDELDASGIERPGIREVFEAVCRVRSRRLPDPRQVPNAGSFFKNPIVTEPVAEVLRRSHPDLPAYPAGPGAVKLSAGWLIEMAGWKGRIVDNVGTWHAQALVLIQTGGATAHNVREVVQAIRSDVNSLFGIELEPEVVIPGGVGVTPRAVDG